MSAARSHAETTQVKDAKRFSTSSGCRKAPPPPAEHDAKEVRKSDVSADFIYFSFTDDSDDRPKPEIRNSMMARENAIENKCIASAMKDIIIKEKQYILKLNTLIKHMEAVVTNVCGKLWILKEIFNFHKNNVLPNLTTISDFVDFGIVFIQNEEHFKSYIHFANIRKDFSFLVMDVATAIIDHFKERLLEYNFWLFEMKNMCSNNYEMKILSEAERIVKDLFQKINVAMEENLDDEKKIIPKT